MQINALSLLMVFFLALSSWSFNNNIGLVNVESAFSQQHEAQKYIKELEEEEQKLLKEEESAKKTIEADMMKMQKELSKMTDKAKIAKEDELRKRIATLQEKFTRSRTALAEKKQKIQLEVENKNRLLIESISRKKKFSMVINMAAVPYISDEMKKNNDITSELVTEYNKAYPVKAPAKKK